MRAHKGLTWFPVLETNEISWQKNPLYEESELIVETPEAYDFLNIKPGKPVYTQFEENPKRFDFVPYPGKIKKFWVNFIP